ncbi:MAG: bacillithiol system redox-active protein YtxJ [Bacteroidetes bacterium]|nr:bacillithiol system redox-active protein YtxJ [Bacteroidota bacterium]MCY4204889.1 bacillithiol system redox-active protein YtxJ [Bacteroidota bacterium]
MSYQKIESIAEFNSLLKQSESGTVVIFKHSSTCDLSANAKDEMLKVNLPVFELVVQTARPLSNHIESHFGIRHESPQVILIHQGKPFFNASHRAVTAKNIQEAAYSAIAP